MHISMESWMRIHFYAINALDHVDRNNITYYSFFEFDFQKSRMISTNFHLLTESKKWVISHNQLLFNKQICLYMKNNHDRLFFLDSKIRDEIFYSTNQYGCHCYYILNNLQETHPIYGTDNMHFYLNWYNSRFKGLLDKSHKEDLGFSDINMDLFRTNLEYVDYFKLRKEEKFILEKISNLKMDIIY